MTRAVLFLASLFLALVAVWAHAQGDSFDPVNFGVQAEARIDGEGMINLHYAYQQTVPETRQIVEEVTKIVEKDGQKIEVKENVLRDITVMRQTAGCSEKRFPAKVFTATDMTGKPIPADKLSAALQEQTMVVIATRKIAPFYLTVYKPEAILIVVKPDDFWAPIEGGTVVPAPDAPAIQLPAPPAPIKPAPAPAPKLETPAALVQPAEVPFVVEPVGPTVILATSVPADNIISLRQYVKDVSYETVTKEVVKDGVKKQVNARICVETVNDVDRKYPTDLLTITRADKKPITAAEIGEQLAKSRCVLASVDGKEVDPKFLKIVRPETLIVVSPLPAPPMGPPMGAVLPALPGSGP